jgi:hypothetical protein
MDEAVKIERLEFALKEIIATVERYHTENLYYANAGLSKASTAKFRAVATRYGKLLHEIRNIKKDLEEANG